MQTTLKIVAELKEIDPETGTNRVHTVGIQVGEDKLNNPAALRTTIQQVLVQLYLGGIPVQEPTRVRLIPPDRLHELWCDIPNILIANLTDIPEVQ